jgi:hypothetical protein
MPTEHDISIPWANKPTYDRFAVALEIQDACNLHAVSRELVKVVAAAALAGGPDVTDDPAVILVVSKIESLVRSGYRMRFADAWDTCQRHVDAKKTETAA